MTAMERAGGVRNGTEIAPAYIYIYIYIPGIPRAIAGTHGHNTHVCIYIRQKFGKRGERKTDGRIDDLLLLLLYYYYT